jgi:hypothetical protein
MGSHLATVQLNNVYFKKKNTIVFNLETIIQKDSYSIKITQFINYFT